MRLSQGHLQHLSLQTVRRSDFNMLDPWLWRFLSCDEDDWGVKVRELLQGERTRDVWGGFILHTGNPVAE